MLSAFRQGLNETGFVEGRKIARSRGIELSVHAVSRREEIGSAMDAANQRLA